MKRTILTALVAAAMVFATAFTGMAAEFPNKPIDLVVPFAAGGNVDLSCRIIANEMEKITGKRFTVLNKPGGGAIVGQTYVAVSKPDGYTMLALTSSFVTNVLGGAASFKKDDFIPVGMYCFDPELIVASEKSGITTYEQFIKAAKERELLNSTPGFSTSHHVASLVFSEKTGAKFKYLHTNGSAEQTVQLAGGHAEVGMTTYAGAASLIDQGKIKVLAVCDDKRIAAMPNVPTMAELGFPFVYGAYRGIAVPKNTPKDVVAWLSDNLGKAMKSPSLIEQFKKAGLPITYMDAPSFTKFLDEDFKSIQGIMHLLKK